MRKNTLTLLSVQIRSIDKESQQIDLPEHSLCCGTGCQNCVYLQYADAIMKIDSQNQREMKRLYEIIDQLEDENLKAFLNFELANKLKK
jgi:hypothetical protein